MSDIKVVSKKCATPDCNKTFLKLSDENRTYCDDCLMDPSVPSVDEFIAEQIGTLRNFTENQVKKERGL